MFNLNPIAIIIILIFIILIILTIYFVNNKMMKLNRDNVSKKNKIIGVFLILLTLLLTGTVAHYINNRTLYQLESELKEEFDNVNCIDISGYGPHCYINVYVEESKFEDIEPIFITVMRNIHKKENFDYISEAQSKNTNGELVFLHICFYTSKKREAESVFEFSSYKDFQEWELDGDSSKKYNLSDYIDN